MTGQRLLAVLIAISGIAAAPVMADSRELIDMLHAAGCNTGKPLTDLRAIRQLDQAAHLWSTGMPLRQALLRAGYRADEVQGLHATGSQGAVRAQLRRQACEVLRDSGLRELGSAARGRQRWLILARAYEPPGPADAVSIAERVLLLTNRARATPRRCGNEPLPAAGPLSLSDTLTRAAAAHARELAARDVLEHRGRNGSTAGQRVRAAGYRPGSVGENIAAGPASAEEVVAGWLASPGHCANLMATGFTELGIAYADAGPGSAGVYWVQLLARPATR